MSEMTIERARVDDFLPIAALDRVAWADAACGEFIPDGEHVWRIWCEHALVFVARDGDRVAGAVLAFPCDDGGWCVHKAFVDATCWGKGVGSRLFAALLEEIDRRGVAAFLTVNPANERAIHLYEKWGFTYRTHVAGFYRPEEDRLVLRRAAADGSA